MESEMILNAIEALPQLDLDFDFGDDMTPLHRDIFSYQSNEEIEDVLRKWASRFQPCVFGQLASKYKKGLDYHLTIITTRTLKDPSLNLKDHLQQERMHFKNRALHGEVSAHLIYFVHPKLAYALPSQAFMNVQKMLCEFHMPEFSPIKEDIIYTESIPYQGTGALCIYKAGVNVLYSSAHGTRNHSRRIPGGFLISVNSPGHFLRAALDRKIYKTPSQALHDVKLLAKRSIGREVSRTGVATAWHSPVKQSRSGTVITEANVDSAYYHGFYHTDVLIPGRPTCDPQQIQSIDQNDPCIFKWNVLFYVSLKQPSPDDPYYGEFVGIPIKENDLYQNPFKPRSYEDGPLVEVNGHEFFVIWGFRLALILFISFICYLYYHLL